MITGLIFGIIGACIIFGTGFFLKTKLTGGVSGALTEQADSIVKQQRQTEEACKPLDFYASKLQLENLSRKAEEALATLESQRALLKNIEGKLSSAQKNIEEKEAQHQEMKASNAADDTKLQELLQKHAQLASDAVALEQQLATSLKDLDSIIASAPLTDDQKNVLQYLSETLGNAGNRLRDLILEYNTVHERLQTLQTQLGDLENEYTRLIEQQLGD